ncbi:MAG: SGNH/GDSL hydrolase family protein [Deltaproteobacteria bacterium]|nr:SGNH/GDSL hydrolase family protein [Deltaproteobacteria bacterium]
MMKEYYVKDPDQRLDAQYAQIGVEQSWLELFGGRSLVEHRAENENGVMVAERLREAGFKGCWVIGLGTCDAANVTKGSNVDRVERIERLMAIIGDEPVLWIDAVTKVEEGYWSAASMQVWNDELATTLSRYPNARIYRWSQDMQDDWYVKDGIHYNSKGYTARAAMVAEALAAAFPGG